MKRFVIQQAASAFKECRNFKSSNIEVIVETQEGEGFTFLIVKLYLYGYYVACNNLTIGITAINLQNNVNVLTTKKIKDIVGVNIYYDGGILFLNNEEVSSNEWLII